MRVLTLNIMANIRDLWKRVALISEFIKANKVDLVFLQEVPSGVIALGDQARAIGGQVGLGYSTCKNWGNWFWKVQQAILWQNAPNRVDEYTVDVGRDILSWNRKMLICQFDHYAAVCVHLGWLDVVDEYGRVINVLKTLQTPVILAGDFNTQDCQGHPLFDELVSMGYSMINVGPTFGVGGNPYGSGQNPTTVDYVWVKGFVIKQTQVVFSSPFVSDHCGVMCDI